MIRVGCIGIGRILKEIHVPGIEASPDLEVHALCTRNEQVLHEEAEKLGIPERLCFTDYRELIRCPEVDAVDIVTPNVTHKEIAACAALAGKPFGLEKPVTMNGAEARELAELVRRSGVPNVVFFSYRFKPAARLARRIIMSGRLGRIYHVNARYCQGWGLPHFDAPRSWRFQKEQSGSGALGDLGSHALDLCRFLTGVEFVSVMAECGTFVKERRLPGQKNAGQELRLLESGNAAARAMDDAATGAVDVDDYANVLLCTAQGIPCVMQTSRFSFGSANEQCVEIFCEHGALKYMLTTEKDSGSVLLRDETSGGEFVEQEIPEELRIFHGTLQMQALADCILGKGDGLFADMEDGLKNQIALDAILESAASGKRIEIP